MILGDSLQVMASLAERESLRGTTRDLWVPGVNALGGFGRWGFGEFRDWAAMEEDFPHWSIG
jgi:hypothetical protein